MEPQLADLFARLEWRKAVFLNLVRPLSDAQTQFRPSPASWSAAEVLQHVYKTEYEIVGQVRVNQGRGQTVSPADRVRGVLLTILFRTPVRLKVPAKAAKVLPNGTVQVAPLLGAWATSRKDLAATLAAFPPSQRSAGVFAHPVSGWMTLPRTMLFLSAHIQHHSLQIHRLKSSMAKAGIK